MEYYLTIIFKLILAVLLGALIGYEREFKNRPAGLRTNILVCLGATLVQIVSLDIFISYNGISSVDPARLGAQVISGIGFLGAGTIMHEGVNVKGLTTAAGLWVVACVGLAIGNGLYFHGILTAILAYITLRALKGIEGHVASRSPFLNIEMQLENKPGQIGRIGQILGSMNVNIKNIELKEYGGEVLDLYLTLKIPAGRDKKEVISKILEIESIYSLEER